MLTGTDQRVVGSASVTDLTDRSMQALLPRQLPSARPVVRTDPMHTAELLGRSPEVTYRREARRLLHGATVLVTGGAGSIGSEIVRQVKGLQPAKVYVLDHDESAMHALALELRGDGLLDDDSTVLADVRDAARMRRLMRELKPDIVYHAAAHKHLPLLERYPAEGVRTNVFGTLRVVSAAADAGVGRFVNISTDKAAEPTSVLGATKRLAELVVGGHAGGGMRVASVRFGNVLGSRGSFLHGLDWQLRHGLPVTITHPDATRFFMTIPEAAGLVVEASAMAEEGETYVLDMGDPVRIMDVVKRYARLSGLNPPMGIEVTGLRPGEKLHEVLLDSDERCERTTHSRISAVRSSEPSAGVGALLHQLSVSLECGDDESLLTQLLAVVRPSRRVLEVDRRAAG